MTRDSCVTSRSRCSTKVGDAIKSQEIGGMPALDVPTTACKSANRTR